MPATSSTGTRPAPWPARIVAIQVVLLAVMGAAQVNASVNGARASGILDFHRVSPLTPTELTLGFFFGAPIREYVLFAATLPFTVLCMAFGVPSFRGFLQLMIIIVTSAWTIHGVMILNGLISRAKNPSGGVVGVVVFLVFFFAYIVMGAQYSVNVVENDHRLNFFGISLPWLPVVLLYQLPTLFFLLLAATRKMESQRLHPLSRPQAIVAMLTFATLVLGGIWRQDSYEVYQMAALYLLTVPALLLTAMITPFAGRVHQGPPSRPEAGEDAAALVGRPLGELAHRGDPGGDRPGGRDPRRHGGGRDVP